MSDPGELGVGGGFSGWGVRELGGAPVLLDTGPLVALLNRRDVHHGWARDVMDCLSPPLLTCEAVISEACHLLRRAPGGPQAVLQMLQRQLIRVDFDLAEEPLPVLSFLTRYADRPTSLADAILVRMAEKTPDAQVLTTDHDFTVYRKHRRNGISLIAPW